MNQTNIVFLSGKYEEDKMNTYTDELCEIIKQLIEKLTIALNMFNSGLLIGEEIIYQNHVFNIILKKSIS